jgi:uncharacterized repeat protein (TIGR04076 family)
MAKVKITVCEIKGNCPVFKEGDKITFDGPNLVMDETDAYCIWASSSFLPYLLAVRYDISSKEIGLSHNEGSYFVQCLDPGPPHTPGGTVLFEIKCEEQ